MRTAGLRPVLLKAAIFIYQTVLPTIRTAIAGAVNGAAMAVARPVTMQPVRAAAELGRSTCEASEGHRGRAVAMHRRPRERRPRSRRDRVVRTGKSGRVWSSSGPEAAAQRSELGRNQRSELGRNQRAEFGRNRRDPPAPALFPPFKGLRGTSLAGPRTDGHAGMGEIGETDRLIRLVPGHGATGRARNFGGDGLSNQSAIRHRARNGDVAERLKALVC